MSTDRTRSTPGHRPTGWRTQGAIVVSSPDVSVRGRAVLLDGSPLTIGRAGHVEGPLALADPELSRQHASLEPEEATGTWWLRDLSSRNGSFVNGLGQVHAGLVDQDVIRVGASSGRGASTPERDRVISLRSLTAHDDAPRPGAARAQDHRRRRQLPHRAKGYMVVSRACENAPSACKKTSAA